MFKIKYVMLFAFSLFTKLTSTYPQMYYYLMINFSVRYYPTFQLPRYDVHITDIHIQRVPIPYSRHMQIFGRRLSGQRKQEKINLLVNYVLENMML